MAAEAAGVVEADSPHPHLSLGKPSEEAIGSGQLVFVDFEHFGLDVDHDVFPAILGPHSGQDLAFVDRVAAPGELFLGVSRCEHWRHSLSI